MKNFEIYEDDVKEYNGDNFCEDFVLPYILKKDDCAGIYCSDCAKRQLLWFLKEYEEPEVDWSKVEVDTPIMVRDSENTEWVKKHFAKVEDGIVYAWNNGETSWTTEGMVDWKYAKLAESERKDNISESNANNQR